eukprot:Gb_00915 [translate_table: standard]
MTGFQRRMLMGLMVMQCCYAAIAWTGEINGRVFCDVCADGSMGPEDHFLEGLWNEYIYFTVKPCLFCCDLPVLDHFKELGYGYCLPIALQVAQLMGNLFIEEMFLYKIFVNIECMKSRKINPMHLLNVYVHIMQWREIGDFWSRGAEVAVLCMTKSGEVLNYQAFTNSKGIFTVAETMPESNRSFIHSEAVFLPTFENSDVLSLTTGTPGATYIWSIGYNRTKLAKQNLLAMLMDACLIFPTIKDDHLISVTNKPIVHDLMLNIQLKSPNRNMVCMILTGDVFFQEYLLKNRTLPGYTPPILSVPSMVWICVQAVVRRNCGKQVGNFLF